MVATALAANAGNAWAQSPAEPSPASGRNAPSLRVTPETVRLKNYLHELASPGAFLGVIGGGLVDHLWQKPAVGNGGADALAGRIGSKAMQAAVEVSVRHGLAAVMDRSTEYQPCECSGFGRRVEHALLETFTDRRADGSRALSVPRIAGAYAAGFAPLAWERELTPGDAALDATLSLGFSALFNIGRELTGLDR
jgi:hypothetical protein